MDKNQFLGRGWQFPPAFSAGNHQVMMNESEANINQSINLVLQTYRGERSLLPDFGSDLHHFLFRNRDATLKDEIALSVRQTLLHDEPRIHVDQVEVLYLAESDELVVIQVDYTIRQTNTRHNHVFPFSLLEGTNLTVGPNGAEPR
ncbi:GPW/gp25 family protein [Vibrio spartinae]|uniref:Baseplate wedge subunit n=1 Tax=Vibrio spartinae TaxID=1918945 RepID=A0A1N6M9S4_9VIBR|nr:GPW/gp25 family protein [Vibrio spartinae]QMV15966.1 baseplate wedge subunit [Vibrio spartinae]SIO96199.1 Gene 25-like lysozyme [Vibrio spartinae]